MFGCFVTIKITINKYLSSFPALLSWTSLSVSPVASFLCQIWLPKSNWDWPRRGQHHHQPPHPTPKRSSRLSLWSCSFMTMLLIQLSFFLPLLFWSPPFVLHICSSFSLCPWSMVSSFFRFSGDFRLVPVMFWFVIVFFKLDKPVYLFQRANTGLTLAY